MKTAFDLGTVQGRRDAVLSFITARPMSLVDICQELRLDGPPERARMRTAMEFLEKSRLIEIALDETGRPRNSRNSLVLKLAGSRDDSPPPVAMASARASASPIVVAEVDEAPASVRRSKYLSVLMTKVLPGMRTWESLATASARAGLDYSVTREAIKAGLHESPPLLKGWSQSKGCTTQRLCEQCLYLPAFAFAVVGVPEGGKRDGSYSLALMTSGAAKWETVAEMAQRTGLSTREVSRLLREDARQVRPAFLQWSRTEGVAPKVGFRPTHRFLPATAKATVKPPKKSPPRNASKQRNA